MADTCYDRNSSLRVRLTNCSTAEIHCKLTERVANRAIKLQKRMPREEALFVLATTGAGGGRNYVDDARARAARSRRGLQATVLSREPIPQPH
jgi:hypothetical protein